MTEAVCPKCGAEHMVSEQRVNMNDRKHYIYCDRCAYLRGYYEVRESEVHF
jgi:transcription elongation factor Elf1